MRQVPVESPGDQDPESDDGGERAHVDGDLPHVPLGEGDDLLSLTDLRQAGMSPCTRALLDGFRR